MRKLNFPFRFHQVNSWSNEKGTNVAVNVWFEHKLNHRPKKCSLTPEEATLDKFVFSDLERQKKQATGSGSEGEGENEGTGEGENEGTGEGDDML